MAHMLYRKIRSLYAKPKHQKALCKTCLCLNLLNFLSNLRDVIDGNSFVNILHILEIIFPYFLTARLLCSASPHLSAGA